MLPSSPRYFPYEKLSIHLMRVSLHIFNTRPSSLAVMICVCNLGISKHRLVGICLQEVGLIKTTQIFKFGHIPNDVPDCGVTIIFRDIGLSPSLLSCPIHIDFVVVLDMVFAFLEMVRDRYRTIVCNPMIELSIATIKVMELRTFGVTIRGRP